MLLLLIAKFLVEMLRKYGSAVFKFANIYNLPVGRGKALGGNMPRVLDALAGLYGVPVL